MQALIGNNSWSSLSTFGRLYHVGTIPSLKGSIYASDLRVMVGSGSDGFFPVAIYARRARLPMSEKLEKGTSSWDMLGTNLSFKVQRGGRNACGMGAQNEDDWWGTDTVLSQLHSVFGCAWQDRTRQVVVGHGDRPAAVLNCTVLPWVCCMSCWDVVVSQNEDGSWGTETDRLLLMDSRDFNRLGVGVDDLIEAYMQVSHCAAMGQPWVTRLSGMSCSWVEQGWGMGQLWARNYITSHGPATRPAWGIRTWVMQGSGMAQASLVPEFKTPRSLCRHILLVLLNCGSNLQGHSPLHWPGANTPFSSTALARCFLDLQTILAVTAIDRLCCKLITPKVGPPDL